MTKLTNEAATTLVRDAIATVAPELAGELETLDPGVDLWDELALDSMDHQTVMTLLFERTGVDIAERDYPRLRSLSALADHLATVSM